MEESGLVKKAPEVIPNVYHSTQVKKAYNIFNFKHEKIAGDIYVYLQELIEFWDWKEYPDFTRFKLKPDRSSVIQGKVIFWEIDRSTMTKARIIEKIEKYLSYARGNNRKFNVIFAASKRRAASIAKEFASYRNPFVWFAAVEIDQLLNNPHEKIFQTIDDKVLSIEELM
ncbi:MAG TPA: replication-relaxation family protein [Pyrinomonadaceae bacterium]|nr:replication-relaxation family protein [Pyrinomonadaceae bacterium]